MGGTNPTTNNVAVSASVTLNKTLRFTNNNTAGTGSATGTFTGAMTGSGGFIKDGPGRVSMTTVTKSYTGPTTVNQGRLRFTDAGQLTGTSSITVHNGGQLYLDSSGTLTWSFGGGSALITLNGEGELFAPISGALRPQTSRRPDPDEPNCSRQRGSRGRHRCRYRWIYGGDAEAQWRCFRLGQTGKNRQQRRPIAACRREYLLGRHPDQQWQHRGSERQRAGQRGCGRRHRRGAALQRHQQLYRRQHHPASRCRQRQPGGALNLQNTGGTINFTRPLPLTPIRRFFP